MANEVLLDAVVTIDGTEYHGTNVSLTRTADAVDVTVFGDTTHQKAGGLKDWTAEFTFFQDEATLGAALWDLVGTTFPLKIRASSDPVSPTNPSYEGTALATSYEPLNGGVGDAATATFSVTAAGALSRVTS